MEGRFLGWEYTSDYASNCRFRLYGRIPSIHIQLCQTFSELSRWSHTEQKEKMDSEILLLIAHLLVLTRKKKKRGYWVHSTKRRVTEGNFNLKSASYVISLKHSVRSVSTEKLKEKSYKYFVSLQKYAERTFRQ